MKRVGLLALGLAAAIGLAGCGKNDGHADHEHSHGHAHQAPHGGALAMLGNHAFQIELVPNADADRLDLYILDGEAENFVRIERLEIRATASVGERRWELSFRPVANAATGETVGDTAHFAADAKGLAGEAKFEIRFDRLELLGQVFESIAIPYPEGVH